MTTTELTSVEIDAVKGDDVAEEFPDPAGPDGERVMWPIFQRCRRRPDRVAMCDRYAVRCTFSY